MIIDSQEKSPKAEKPFLCPFSKDQCTQSPVKDEIIPPITSRPLSRKQAVVHQDSKRSCMQGYTAYMKKAAIRQPFSVALFCRCRKQEVLQRSEIYSSGLHDSPMNRPLWTEPCSFQKYSRIPTSLQRQVNYAFCRQSSASSSASSSVSSVSSFLKILYTPTVRRGRRKRAMKA